MAVRMAKAAVNQANINATEMKGIRIAVPPADLQAEFVSQLRQVEEQRTACLRLFSVGDELFASLQSRAFRGEL